MIWIWQCGQFEFELGIYSKKIIFQGQPLEQQEAWDKYSSEYFKRKLLSYTHFRFTRTRQPLLQKPSYLEFLRDDEIIDHSVEGDELESLIAEFGSLIPNVNPNETNFGGRLLWALDFWTGFSLVENEFMPTEQVTRNRQNFPIMRLVENICVCSMIMNPSFCIMLKG